MNSSSLRLTVSILIYLCAVFALIHNASAQDYGVNSNTGIDSYEILFIIILFGIIIGLLIRKRHTYARKYFAADVKRKILKKQGHKCAKCNWNTGVFDFDHKDGNRSNNKMSNCQALCRNCHAKKSRGLMKVRKESKGSIKTIVFLFFFLVFVSLFFFNWT